MAVSLECKAIVQIGAPLMTSAVPAVMRQKMRPGFVSIRCIVETRLRRRTPIRLIPSVLMKIRTLFSVLAALSAVAVASAKSVVDIAIGSPDHTTLVAAVKAAGLVETLSGKGPFTVFAPTNAAFAKLPPGTVENLLKPENKAQLIAVLTYHVVPAKVMAADVKTGSAPTVNGKAVNLVASMGKVTVNGANVVAADLAADNGVVHVIDTVILP